MQILKSLHFQNVFQPLFHENVQKLHCFITNEFCELCEWWATKNSSILKSAMLQADPHFFFSLIVINIFQSIKTCYLFEFLYKLCQ